MRLELEDSIGYYHDFYISDEESWVEVEGCEFYDPMNKTTRFQEQYPNVNYVVAHAETLRERFGLDLSAKRLSEVAKASKPK